MLLVACLLATGCAQTRIITITTTPPDATIKVDGIDHGRGQVTVPLTFKNAQDTHVVTVSRRGYKEQPRILTRDNVQDPLVVDLKPLTRQVTFNITPVPAEVLVDGKPITDSPVSSVSTELQFTLDEKNNWTTHTVRAQRPGFAPAERVVSWVDPDQDYTLNLSAVRKDLNITTTPPGATVTLDGEPAGATPITIAQQPFPIDLQSGQYQTKKLTVSKKGYDPIERTIGWDDGETDYHIDLVPKTKTVRIVTQPPGATVTLDGRELDHDPSGAAVAENLPFPPVDENGTLRTYTATVSHRTADSEWQPKELTFGWDDGKADYSISLKEILTRPVPLVSLKMVKSEDGWQATPDWSMTLAMKSTEERAGQPQPTRVTDVRGAIIDSLAVSPDGSHIIYSTLAGKDAAGFRSQLIVINATGAGGPQQFSDGKSLDIMPSYTPSGDEIIFSSNRAGRSLSIWSMSANGAWGVRQLTSGDSNDLWPMVDNDPKPRLFYQSYVETRPDPRLYMIQLGNAVKTDLTHIGGMQPRVSPKADQVLFTSVNEKTGKRDIYLMRDTGGAPQNLTNTPDIDEHSPAWSRDADRIAFAADRAEDKDGRHNYDIWVIDVAHPEQPAQVTSNASLDDTPVWDPASPSALYFRSNRGGDWAIWRIDLK